jgi:hypothetical protein
VVHNQRDRSIGAVQNIDDFHNPKYTRNERQRSGKESDSDFEQKKYYFMQGFMIGFSHDNQMSIAQLLGNCEKSIKV